MRLAAKRDQNERDIIAALTRIGASVQPLSGKDIPDLLVGFRGANYLLEVKQRKGKLRPGQAAWHEAWRGNVAKVTTVDEALAAIGATQLQRIGAVLVRVQG